MRFLPIAAVAMVPLLVGTVGWLVGAELGVDTAVYRAGALTLLHGEPLYDSDVVGHVPDWALLPFTYPPVATLLFIPLAPLPIAVAWGVSGALSVAALAVVVKLALCYSHPPLRGAHPPWTWQVPPAVPVAVLVAAFVVLEPVWRTISLGQVNLVLMALVMVDVLVLCRRGSRFGGVLIGVASAVKLTPLIFVAHLVVTGRWRDAVRALATFTGMQAGMYLLIPGDVSRYWTDTIGEPGRIGPVHWSDNQALHGLVLRLTDSAPASLAVALAFGALLATPALILVLRFHRRGDELAALLVTAFYGLLISPVSWAHHWVWAVPLILVVAGWAAQRRDRPSWIAVAALVAVFASYVVLLVPGGRDPAGWGLVDHLLGNAYLYVPFVLAALLLTNRSRVVNAEQPGRL